MEDGTRRTRALAFRRARVSIDWSHQVYRALSPRNAASGLACATPDSFPLDARGRWHESDHTDTGDHVMNTSPVNNSVGAISCLATSLAWLLGWVVILLIIGGAL
jgi:hypothetical protein